MEVGIIFNLVMDFTVFLLDYFISYSYEIITQKLMSLNWRFLINKYYLFEVNKLYSTNNTFYRYNYLNYNIYENTLYFYLNKNNFILFLFNDINLQLKLRHIFNYDYNYYFYNNKIIFDYNLYFNKRNKLYFFKNVNFDHNLFTNFYILNIFDYQHAYIFEKTTFNVRYYKFY